MTLALSVNPAWRCSAGCPFCYLAGRRDGRVMPPGELAERLAAIDAEYGLGDIDLYGGELLDLPPADVSAYVEACRKYCPRPVLITSLPRTEGYEKILSDPGTGLGVSWDYVDRPDWEGTLRRVESLGRPCGLLLTSPGLYARRKDVAAALNSVAAPLSVSVKPYYRARPGQPEPDWERTQSLVLYLWSNLRHGMEVDRNRFSEPHAFLSPDGDQIGRAHV